GPVGAVGRRGDRSAARPALAPRSTACRHPAPPTAGGLHSSFRSGLAVCGRRYRAELAKAGLRGSMGRRGNPYDNAQAESFMKTLKVEEVYLVEYDSFEEVAVTSIVLCQQEGGADAL